MARSTWLSPLLVLLLSSLVLSLALLVHANEEDAHSHDDTHDAEHLDLDTDDSAATRNDTVEPVETPQPVEYEKFDGSHWLIPLNDATYDSFIEHHTQDHAVLVYWHSTVCAPCSMYSNQAADVAYLVQEQVLFASVDTHHNKELLNAFRMKIKPSYLFYPLGTSSANDIDGPLYTDNPDTRVFLANYLRNRGFTLENDIDWEQVHRERLANEVLRAESGTMPVDWHSTQAIE